MPARPRPARAGAASLPLAPGAPGAAPASPGALIRRAFAPRSNARGILFNLAGAAAPALLALLAVPRITSALGPERFGILALAWTAIGYVSFLHLGLGRAVMRDAASSEDGGGLEAAVWTAAAMTFAIGTAGAAAVFALAPALARALHVPAAMAGEAAAAFRTFAVAVPFTITTPVLSAVLESRRRFDLVNAVAVPSSAVTYLGPVAVLAFTRGLVPVIGVLVAGRVLTWLAYAVLCAAQAPSLLRPRLEPRRAGPLLAFGGWTTVSAVVSPLLVSLDRFVVGAMLSAAAVGYYFTGQEAVLRMGMVSGAVVTVLFPAAAAVRADEGRRLGELLDASVEAVGLLVLPLTLLLAAFPGELLRLWLGARWAAEGQGVLVWLSVGLLVNSLAKMPSSALQAQGRPDLTAWLHVAELPPFVAVLCLLVWRWGIDGAAAAWTARVAADAAALFWLSVRRTPETRGAAVRAATLSAVGAGGVLALRLLPGPGPRALALAAAAVPFAVAAWRVLGRRAAPALAPAAR